jgi:hypothetical protein
MAFDSNGYLYGCSNSGTIVRVITANTPPTIATNWAVGGGTTNCALTIDSTYLYSALSSSTAGTLLRVLLSAPIGTAMQSFGPAFNSPEGLLVNPYGLLFVSATGSGRVDTVVASTGVVQTAGVYTTTSPNGMVFDTTGGIWIADPTTQTVAKLAVYCPIPSPPSNGAAGTCTSALNYGTSCQFSCTLPYGGGINNCLYGSNVGGCYLPCTITTVPNG